jgi:hypothetical protein
MLRVIFGILLIMNGLLSEVIAISWDKPVIAVLIPLVAGGLLLYIAGIIFLSEEDRCRNNTDAGIVP